MQALRAAFLEALPAYDVSCLRFVDETSGNLTYCRRYGRALGGTRVRQGVRLHTGANVTVVGALSGNGLEAVMELEGARDATSFALYIDQVLGPTWQPGDVVVLDNLPVHKVVGMRERVEAWGAQGLYLPPYSPDFAPIERGWKNRSKCPARPRQPTRRETSRRPFQASNRAVEPGAAGQPAGLSASAWLAAGLRHSPLPAFDQVLGIMQRIAQQLRAYDGR